MEEISYFASHITALVSLLCRHKAFENCPKQQVPSNLTQILFPWAVVYKCHSNLLCSSRNYWIFFFSHIRQHIYPNYSTLNLSSECYKLLLKQMYSNHVMFQAVRNKYETSVLVSFDPYDIWQMSIQLFVQYSSGNTGPQSVIQMNNYL